MNQTWYLKYRPQSVSDLDLVAVRQTLSSVFKTDHIPHAFLFVGSRGIGKTSAARILAKAVNCPHLKNSEPCNSCESCTTITAGTNLDVVEIDAASNRGIDEIRDLREKIKLTPLSSKYKVYIIDEVHMLTTEAFNALLKTLEEPPPHAMFVLCTTESDKLPETVVSRCTVVKFQRPTLAEIQAKLHRVTEGEKLKYSPAELELVAKAARGSFRDGIKILEQAAISGQPVKEMLGVFESADPKQFLNLVADGSTTAALDYIANLVSEGVNVRTFIEKCVEVLREELLNEVSAKRSPQATLDLISRFETAYERNKTTSVAQLPLEILVVESLDQDGGEKPPLSPKEEEKLDPVPVPISAPVKVKTNSKYSLAEVEAKWPDILKTVRPKNHSVEALLKSTRPLDFDGETFSLEVFYKFHKDKLETEKCRSIVEEAMESVFGGGPIKLKLSLGQKSRNEEVSAKNIEEDIIKAAEEIFKVDAL